MNNEMQKTTNNLSLAISEAQEIILSQTTPLEHVRFRKGRGGRQFPYTDTAFVIRTLNQAFGWDWDFEADHEEILYIYPDGIQRPYEVRCRGKLTVRNDGRAITKMQFGSQPLEFLQNTDTPISLGDAFKGAASDALKKCASLLGIALDLYDSDSPINENPAKAQQQQAQQTKAPQPRPTNGTAARKSEATPVADPTPKQEYNVPTSPNALMIAINAALGKKYYNHPKHIFEALKLTAWPKPIELGSWADIQQAAFDYARDQLAEKAQD